MDTIRLVEARSEAEYAAARALFLEYAAAPGGHVSFQSYDAEFDALPTMYGPPRGCLLLALRGDREVSGVALRPHAGGDGEMERLYVRPESRGTGLGRLLTERIPERSQAARYRRVVLETLEKMVSALNLYGALGFGPRSVPATDPQPGVRYMESSLVSTARR